MKGYKARSASRTGSKLGVNVGFVVVCGRDPFSFDAGDVFLAVPDEGDVVDCMTMECRTALSQGVTMFCFFRR